MKKIENILPSKLVLKPHPARHWRAHPKHADRVECLLSPRHCSIPEGGLGFCGVRANQNGNLVTLNYGKSVQITEEIIENEAVLHFSPGAKILSLGNIGCMMHCDFCQNWSTSQARSASNKDIVLYTPEAIVEYALQHDISILSWTYNDPVVWHEFVCDTAALAHKHGLLNLYKSAFYIEPAAVNELIEVIDIFSISLKSMDEKFYIKHTKAQLNPVLDAIKLVYESGRHLEISNLCVTGRNDNMKDVEALTDWVLEELGAEVPLHFVRFHPDYQYDKVQKTSISFLEEARRAAIDKGCKHVYLGNVDNSEGINSYCDCGALLVERYGLHTNVFMEGDRCPNCSVKQNFKCLELSHKQQQKIPENYVSTTYDWNNDNLAIHVLQEGSLPIYYSFHDSHSNQVGVVSSSSCTRFSIAKCSADCKSSKIYSDPDSNIRIYEAADRAHYPGVATFEQP